VPRRNLLAVMMSLNLVVLAGLLVVTVSGADTVWPFFVLAFVQGIGSAIGAPAGRALTPSLVPQEILVTALAQRSIVLGLSAVVAPAVGGILFAIQAELVYSISIGLALVALGCALGLRSGRVPAAEGALGLDEVLAGVRLIRRTNVLLGAISLDLFAVLLGGAVALLPVFAKDILEVGPTGLGLLRAAPAVGALVGAAIIARYPIRRHAGPTLFVVVAGFGLCMVAFGLSRQLWLSMLALALGAGLDMVSVVLRQTILPLVTPDELRGRVNAVEMVFISGSNELGAFESGVAAALIGAVPAVVLGGVATVVVAAVWWKLFPSLARVDRLDDLRPVAAEPS
jgi:MFS family permease